MSCRKMICNAYQKIYFKEELDCVWWEVKIIFRYVKKSMLIIFPIITLICLFYVSKNLLRNVVDLRGYEINKLEGSHLVMKEQ